MARTIAAAELEPLATGAWILGTGGGGSPHASYLSVKGFYDAGGTIALLDASELDDADMIAVVSTMGAPLVFQERMTDPDFALAPLRAIEAYLGRSFRAVMAVEIGGCNAFQPLLVAAASGLPVVDADAMGRAFPEAQMQSFAIADLAMCPHAVADIRGTTVLVTNAASWHWLERTRRKVCTEFGSVATTCQAPRTGAEVKQHAVLGSISRAIALGNEVHRARAAHEDPVAALLQAADGRLLFSGKVVDVQRKTTEGFLRGTVRLSGTGAEAGAEFEAEFQNEFAVGRRDTTVVVTTPDLICILDSVSGESIGTEMLRYGQRASVVAFPAPAIHRSPKGLEHVGPRAFGHPIDYVSAFAGTALGSAA